MAENSPMDRKHCGNKSGKLSQDMPVLPQVITIHEIS